MVGCVVDINPRLVAFELREYEVKSWFPTEQDHYLTSSNKTQNMDHFYRIKKNTVYNVEMYRDISIKSRNISEFMILYIQSQFMVKLLNFSFYRLEDTYMSQIFFMDTRHQKDELIVEFFGMLMSERSKTIRIPSLHVNKLSKLR